VAIQLNYTSDTETNYPVSYWKLVAESYDKEAQYLSLSFEGFKDSTAADRNSTPIARKDYVLSPAEYVAQFSQIFVGNPPSNLSTAAYNYAIAKLESSGLSFFDGGVNV